MILLNSKHESILFQTTYVFKIVDSLNSATAKQIHHSLKTQIWPKRSEQWHLRISQDGHKATKVVIFLCLEKCNPSGFSEALSCWSWWWYDCWTFTKVLRLSAACLTIQSWNFGAIKPTWPKFQLHMV